MRCKQRLSSRYVFITIVLFIVGLLIYDHYWQQYSFRDHSFNKNLSIEQALQQIPTCTLDDRPRQRALLSILQEWIQFTRQHHIRYWITYGSLVGYVQRGGLLPHDKDIDVTIMAEDTPKLIKIAQSNSSSDYKMLIQPHWKIVDYKKRSYFYEKNINFIELNARLIHQQTQMHVDIYPAYDFNPLNSINSTDTKQSEILTQYDNSYKWLTHPRNWTYPLQICYFSKIQTLCPAQPEKFVEAVYGTSAVNKSDTKCDHGRWVSNV